MPNFSIQNQWRIHQKENSHSIVLLDLTDLPEESEHWKTIATLIQHVQKRLQINLIPFKSLSVVHSILRAICQKMVKMIGVEKI